MATICDDISTGRRLYVRAAYGEPIVAALKRLGAHWDADRKAWWITPKKRPEVEALLVGADQAEDEARDKGEPTPKEDPRKIRLTGKGEYKGKAYYLGARTKDGARVRCLTLPDAKGDYLDFWADASAVQVTKTYQTRQVWDGRRYSGRTIEQHTTLGSIQRFLRQQKDPATRRGECSECGAWGPAGEACSECGGEGSYI